MVAVSLGKRSMYFIYIPFLFASPPPTVWHLQYLVGGIWLPECRRCGRDLCGPTRDLWVDAWACRAVVHAGSILVWYAVCLHHLFQEAIRCGKCHVTLVVGLWQVLCSLLRSETWVKGGKKTKLKLVLCYVGWNVMIKGQGSRLKVINIMPEGL